MDVSQLPQFTDMVPTAKIFHEKSRPNFGSASSNSIIIWGPAVKTRILYANLNHLTLQHGKMLINL